MWFIKLPDAVVADYVHSSSVDGVYGQRVHIAEISIENNLSSVSSSEDLGLNRSYTYFSFSKENWRYGNITFQFATKNANDFKFGISVKGDLQGGPVKMPVNIMNLILQKFDRSKEKDKWWLFFDYFEGSNRNWSNQPQPWIDIETGIMKKRINSIVKDFLEKIDDLQL